MSSEVVQVDSGSIYTTHFKPDLQKTSNVSSPIVVHHQPTTVLMDPPSTANRPVLPAENKVQTVNYNEIRPIGKTSFFQSKKFVIALIVIILGLLAACIALSIALAAVVRSTTTAPIVTSTNTPTTVFTTANQTSSTSVTTSSAAPTNCGIQAILPDVISPRIYGGKEAIPHSWPWIISYEEDFDCNNDTCSAGTCGATLIHPQYVLTAAHCIHSLNNSIIILAAGVHNRTSTTEDDMRQYRIVKNIYIHPGYNPTTITNDICILSLSTPFQLTDYVQLACLPGNEPKANDTVVVIGWGSTTAYGGETSDVLKQAFTQVVGNCSNIWGVDDAQQICVGNSVSGDSVCSGDSGGPLLLKNGNRWVVDGVTSFVATCMTNDSLPNVFTRVAYYLPWINQIITK